MVQKGGWVERPSHRSYEERSFRTEGTGHITAAVSPAPDGGTGGRSRPALPLHAMRWETERESCRRDGERKRPEKSSSPAPSLSTTGVAAREAETTPISVRDAALREERGYRKNRVTRPRTQLLGLVTPDGGGTYSSRMERTSRRARSSILRAAFLRYHPYSTNERTIHVRLSSTVHHDAIFSSWRFLEFYFRASRGPYYSVMGSSRSWFLNSKAICVDRDGISIDDMNQFSLARSTPILSEIFRHSMNSTTFPLHKTAIMPNFFR